MALHDHVQDDLTVLDRRMKKPFTALAHEGGRVKAWTVQLAVKTMQ
jgi:hypothetical protein